MPECVQAFTWSHGSGMCQTVFSGDAAASYVAYTASDDVLIVDGNSTFRDTFTRWQNEERVNALGIQPVVSTVACGAVAARVTEAYKKNG